MTSESHRVPCRADVYLFMVTITPFHAGNYGRKVKYCFKKKMKCFTQIAIGALTHQRRLCGELQRDLVASLSKSLKMSPSLHEKLELQKLNNLLTRISTQVAKFFQGHSMTALREVCFFIAGRFRF